MLPLQGRHADHHPIGDAQWLLQSLQVLSRPKTLSMSSFLVFLAAVFGFRQPDPAPPHSISRCTSEYACHMCLQTTAHRPPHHLEIQLASPFHRHVIATAMESSKLQPAPVQLSRYCPQLRIRVNDGVRPWLASVRRRCSAGLTAMSSRPTFPSFFNAWILEPWDHQ